jgi:cytochrome P450
VPHILSATRETIAELDAALDRPVNLLSAVQRLALEIAGRTMFSLEMRQHSMRMRDLIWRYSRRLGRAHLLDIFLPVGVPSPYDLARMWFRRGWTALIEEVMAERQGNPRDDAPRDLFDLLMAARDPESGAVFSPEQLRDQVATMILAGHETTAVALFWSLYLLALAPEVQERVAEEASGMALDQPAPERLSYTRAVLDEAMRLYPPAFVIVRAANGPDVVGGVRVKRGDLMFVAPWVVHRHRRLWQDPDAFAPEWFLPGAAAVDRFAYLPFGVGPRVCIGAQFALTEATLVLASLIRSFRIELVGSRPVLPIGVVTTQPDHAPPFRLQRR